MRVVEQCAEWSGARAESRQLDVVARQARRGAGAAMATMASAHGFAFPMAQVRAACPAPALAGGWTGRHTGLAVPLGRMCGRGLPRRQLAATASAATAPTAPAPAESAPPRVGKADFQAACPICLETKLPILARRGR